MRELGIRSAAAGPILLGGRVWGALSANWPEGIPMPVGAEYRVAALAELVSYGIENAETREQLAACARGSSRPPTRHADGSSATCTTGRSSDSWPPRSS
jgi:hypothetical protein